MKKILILEDDPNASLIVGWLREKGYSVIFANNLLDAFYYLEVDGQRITYDAIMWDLTLNGVRAEFKNAEGKDVTRDFNDQVGMNGYLYFKELYDTVLKKYVEDNRFRFYTAYTNELKVRFCQDFPELEQDKMTFSKTDSKIVGKIFKWLDTLKRRDPHEE